MFHEGAATMGFIRFLPGHSAAGAMVWLLVIVGVIGFLVSLFRR